MKYEEVTLKPEPKKYFNNAKRCFGRCCLLNSGRGSSDAILRFIDIEAGLLANSDIYKK